MASIINAVDVLFSVDGVPVGCVSSADLTIDRDMDVSTCGASGGWEQVSPGIRRWSASVNSIYREFTSAELATNVSFANALDMLVDGTLVELTFGKPGTGSTRYIGSAYINQVKYTHPESGAVTWSASFTGNGAITVEV